MRLYESVFIARQDVSTSQVESLTKDFSTVIENAGGKIHKHEYWGLRTLAYRERPERSYVMMNLRSIRKHLLKPQGLNEDILRS